MAPVRDRRPAGARHASAHAVLAFIFLYFMTASVLTFAMLLTGLDFDSAFTVVVASHQQHRARLRPAGRHPQPARTHRRADWICIAAMLLGRLEIFSVIVLLTPAYWRK